MGALGLAMAETSEGGLTAMMMGLANLYHWMSGIGFPIMFLLYLAAREDHRQSYLTGYEDGWAAAGREQGD